MFGQDDYVVSKSKPVKIASNDTIILASASRSGLPDNKVEKYKRYYWFSKGKIQSNVGGFHGNLLHGDFELFKSENLVVKGIYKNGLKDGVWKAWDTNGRYSEITNWNKGVIDGELTSYYKNGLKKSVFKYKDGLKKGQYLLFDEKGNVKESGKYKNDLKKGKVFLFENGEERIVKYKNGVMVLPKVKKQKEKNHKENNAKVPLKAKFKAFFNKKTDKMEDKGGKQPFGKIKKLFKKKDKNENLNQAK
tara:strand:+ start:211 stop:954 length:744 start_codon:yes stop_codon:yes gene_type:complete